jgi:hypothetical protein
MERSNGNKQRQKSKNKKKGQEFRAVKNYVYLAEKELFKLVINCRATWK